METEKPNHAPAHRAPAWLSSEDVRDALKRVAEAGGDKATLWDVLYEVNCLVAAAHAPKFEQREVEPLRKDDPLRGYGGHYGY